jgi:hypothetical protein
MSRGFQAVLRSSTQALAMVEIRSRRLLWKRPVIIRGVGAIVQWRTRREATISAVVLNFGVVEMWASTCRFAVWGTYLQVYCPTLGIADRLYSHAVLVEVGGIEKFRILLGLSAPLLGR